MLQSQQGRLNELAAPPELSDGDEAGAEATRAQQQQAEAAVQSATGNLHGKQDALQRAGLAQQTLVVQVRVHILQSCVLPCSVCCPLPAVLTSTRLAADCSAVLLIPCMCIVQIVESFSSLLAAMEPAAEGEDEAIASYQAWRTWTLGVLQAFLRGHIASLAHIVGHLQKQVLQSTEISDDVRTVLNLYCEMS